MKLAGRVALVTGASRGIGRETARALARRGARVALVARDRSALETLAAQIGAERALAVPADLTDLAQTRAAVEAAHARFGRVDALVNNAGLLSGHDFLETPVEQLAAIVDLNYRAAVVLTRLVAEGMAARRGGHIVNVASYAGVTGLPGEAAYAGTKGALRLFTASLRPELAAHGIHLTDVLLGPITTGMLDTVEENPRVRRTFNRVRALRLVVDTPAAAVGEAIAVAIERRQAVVSLPSRASPLVLPFQGVSRTLFRLLSR